MSNMVQISAADLNIFKLFSYLANPQPGESVEDYLMEFCSSNISHDNVEQEVNEIINHESFQFLYKAYKNDFLIDLKNWFNDCIEMCKVV